MSLEIIAGCVTAQMGIEQGEKGKRFVLRINGKNILDWFREQFERLLRRIREKTMTAKSNMLFQVDVM